jgi:hypothetical protein
MKGREQGEGQGVSLRGKDGMGEAAGGIPVTTLMDPSGA